MSKIADNSIREFILQELPLVTDLLLKKVDIDYDVPLQDFYESEDVAEMAEIFFHHFNVQSDGFRLTNYYPWKVKTIFLRKISTQDKSPLTIRMFIASVSFGYWPYK